MSTHDRGRVPVRTPGELIAAIPHLVGFRPTDSLVLIALGRQAGPIGGVMRADLPHPDQVQDWIIELRDLLARNHQQAVIHMVVIGGQTVPGPAELTTSTSPTPGSGSGRLPAHELIDALTAVLSADGISVAEVLWAASTDAGVWHCYRDNACTGVIPDPQTVPMVTALIVDGAVVYGSREEIAASLAGEAPAVLARRAELIATLGPVNASHELAFLTDIVHRLQSGSSPVFNDATIARLAYALTDPTVRGGAHALCVQPPAEAAEYLWRVLVRGVPAPWSAEPAYLLGVCAFLRGAGVLAEIALGMACAGDPDHRLAPLVRMALRTGMRPEALRAFMQASLTELPPAEPSGPPPTSAVPGTESEG